MTTSIARLSASALPALSGSHLTYNAAARLWMTGGYTSAAGNFYNKGVRFSERIAIHYDIGNNTFLNGITLYAWNGNRAVLIGHKEWGGRDNYRFYSESFAREQTTIMLKNYLEGAARAAGQYISDSELTSFARRMVEEAEAYSSQRA